ncbi:MAG TPA: GNAT family N-acetyltransferase [Longimicrobiaceae bacterium]|nr:GNAT family N-acetyltransferase [Longimicrobiaceae bacterium]
MPALTTQLDETPSGADLDRIVRGVRAFNRSVGGQEPPRPVACFLRDGAGEMVGGAWGELWGRALHVAALWVDEGLRGQGHGAALLRELEAYALRRGHPLAYVETLSYQARPFYEKQGYRVFGELEGVAEGCTYYFLRKDLGSAAPPA